MGEILESGVVHLAKSLKLLCLILWAFSKEGCLRTDGEWWDWEHPCRNDEVGESIRQI